MRWSLVVLLFSTLNLCAQQQERSLIDRLLRPDLTLQNRYQNKKFATNSARIEGRGNVRTFFLQPKTPAHEKSFDDTRMLSTKQYPANSFNLENATNSLIQTPNAMVPRSLAPSTARESGNSADAGRIAPTRTFAGQREFREEGKAQKSLNRKNPPLTVEQVRELLDKNK